MKLHIVDRSARYLAILHDMTVSFAAFWLAHLIAWGYPDVLFAPGIKDKSLAFFLFTGVGIAVSGLHRGHWRYASISDMLAIAKAATIAVILFTIANFMWSRAESISRVAIILNWVFMMFGLGAGRILYRIIKERQPLFFTGRPPINASIALLYPFSDSTDHFLRAQNRLNQHKHWPVGIIDDRGRMQGQKVQGVSVIGTRLDIPNVVGHLADKAISVHQLIVTDPRISGTEMTELLDLCNRAGIKVTKLPDFQSTAGKDKGLLEPKAIKLEDLLGRSENRDTNLDVGNFISGRSVMVTGAGGSIGSELCRQIAAARPSLLILIEFSEHNLYNISAEFEEAFPDIPIKPLIADIRDKKRIDKILNDERPSVIFHAAALKHVPIVENNPWEAIKTNLLGTAEVARSAKRYDVETFVLVSTDKAVNPSSIMGASKRAAELYCQAMDAESSTTRFRIVRFGNVLGSAGSVIPRFQKQIAAGGPVTVTDPEITRYFMTIPEAVQLLLRAASQNLDHVDLKGCIFVLDMGQPVKIIDLARRLILLAGFQPENEIPILYTGLRQGEKIYEELISDNESTIEIGQEGYILTYSVPPTQKAMETFIADLNKLSQQEENFQALDLLLRITTGYLPGEPFLLE